MTRELPDSVAPATGDGMSAIADGQDAGASCGPGSREPSPEGLGPTGFDPSRGDLISRNIAHVREAFARIGVDFESIESGNRILAFASAMVAEAPLREALIAIAAMETPSANATVRRMAARARDALSDSDGSPEGGAASVSVEDDSAGRQASPDA